MLIIISHSVQQTRVTFILKTCLSYDITVIHWITSCHESDMTIHVITLECLHVTLLTTTMSAMRFLTETMFILKVDKNPILKGRVINRLLHL